MTRHTPSARLGLGIAILVLFAWASPPVARAEQKVPGPTTGRWLLDFERDGSLQLTLKRKSDGARDNWSSSDDFHIGEFQGLQRPASSAEVSVHFLLVRDAGTVAFDGQLNDSGGSGRFRFEPNPEFIAALAKMGYAQPDAGEAFSLAARSPARRTCRSRIWWT